MEIKTRLAALLLVLVINPCWAVTVKGAFSCGDWVKWRKGAQVTKTVAEVGLISYLSGLAVGSGTDALVDSSNESIFLWTDNYCQKNPLNNIYDGGDKLFNELGKKKNH